MSFERLVLSDVKPRRRIVCAISESKLKPYFTARGVSRGTEEIHKRLRNLLAIVAH